jgi:DNA invertase Pin-like site-specific DNA recombinase
VKRQLASKAVYGGGKPPYGFNVENGRLVLNHVQQEKISVMSQMRSGNASFREIGQVVGLHAMTVKRILDRHQALTADRGLNNR